jgi:hypothetical protein
MRISKTGSCMIVNNVTDSFSFDDSSMIMI